MGELPPISALGCPRESFCSSKDTGRPQWDPCHSLEVYFLAFGNVVGFAVCSVLLVKNSFHGHFFASKTNPYSTSRIIQFVNGDFFLYASSWNFGFSVVKTNEIEISFRAEKSGWENLCTDPAPPILLSEWHLVGEWCFPSVNQHVAENDVSHRVFCYSKWCKKHCFNIWWKKKSCSRISPRRAKVLRIDIIVPPTDTLAPTLLDYTHPTAQQFSQAEQRVVGR